MSDPYAMLKAQTNKGQKMKNSQLSQLIQDRFMPFAYTCECKGSHPDCAEAMRGSAMWAQADTVLRIALFIAKLDETN